MRSPQKARPAAVLRWLQQGHQRFLAGQSLHPHSTRERMQSVVEGQHPLAAVLGRADSRVPVELLFDGGFGDLFVVRNAGTMRHHRCDRFAGYAVGHLDIPLIVVLGHEGCGAVSAALHPELVLTPSLAQVVGQLRMELLQYGDQLSLEESCRRLTPQRGRQPGALQRAAHRSPEGESAQRGGGLLRPASLLNRVDGSRGAHPVPRCLRFRMVERCPEQQAPIEALVDVQT